MSVLDRFSSRLSYVKVDFSKPEEFQNLKEWLDEAPNLLHGNAAKYLWHTKPG